mgnify:CR=1 FL=1
MRDTFKCAYYYKLLVILNFFVAFPSCLVFSQEFFQLSVKRVTFFPDGAIIIREGTFYNPLMSDTLKLGPFPGEVLNSSFAIRVFPEVQIEWQGYFKGNENITSIKRKISELRTMLNVFKEERELLQFQLRVIKTNLSIKGQNTLIPEDVFDFLEEVSKRYSAILKKIRSIDEEKKKLLTQIDSLEMALSKMREDTLPYIYIRFKEKPSDKHVITVSYFIRGIELQKTYRIYYREDSAQAQIFSLFSVLQNTGEHWKRIIVSFCNIPYSGVINKIASGEEELTHELAKNLFYTPVYIELPEVVEIPSNEFIEVVEKKLNLKSTIKNILVADLFPYSIDVLHIQGFHSSFKWQGNYQVFLNGVEVRGNPVPSPSIQDILNKIAGDEDIMLITGINHQITITGRVIDSRIKQKKNSMVVNRTEELTVSNNSQFPVQSIILFPVSTGGKRVQVIKWSDERDVFIHKNSCIFEWRKSIMPISSTKWTFFVKYRILNE